MRLNIHEVADSAFERVVCRRQSKWVIRAFSPKAPPPTTLPGPGLRSRRVFVRTHDLNPDLEVVTAQAGSFAAVRGALIVLTGPRALPTLFHLVENVVHDPPNPHYAVEVGRIPAIDLLANLSGGPALSRAAFIPDPTYGWTPSAFLQAVSVACSTVGGA